MSLQVVLGITAVFGGLLCYVWYAVLVARRNRLLEALSGVDVQLRKRFDLIPGVLKMAARFMQHERDLLARITTLRQQSMQGYDRTDPQAVKAHLDAAGELLPSLGALFAVAEDYPELKSNETMVRAQDTFTEVEAHIAAARRAYNATVTALNNAAQIFPGNLIAAAMNVRSWPYFEQQDSVVRQRIDVDDYLT